MLLGASVTAPAWRLQVLDREKIRQTVISQLMPLRRHSEDQGRARPQVTLRQQLQVSACAVMAHTWRQQPAQQGWRSTSWSSPEDSGHRRCQGLQPKRKCNTCCRRCKVLGRV